MSLTWDIRTVLASEAAPVLVYVNDAKTASEAERSRSRLEPIDIWNYLISLSRIVSGPKSNSEMDYTKLRHYKATDFGRGWDGAGKYIGDGASYSVAKYTLDQTTDGKPFAVAVKKLKMFQEHNHQRSVATVLKELRILTHPPLQFHLNIVSLLGYRSDFTSTSDSSLQSTNIALVAEFAPFGTLGEFCQSLAPDKNLDLITKAHLMHDIASGIEALHKCAIAHGDVKMENTLVFEGYNRPYMAKLSDFGHSLVDLHTPEQSSQVYLGTPIFNAPEIRSRSQRVPMEREALFKCDIYSFGLLSWELILGGMRFYKTLGDMMGTEDITSVVSRLSTLPKDELLFRSITSLKEAHGSEDALLVQIVNQVLQASLRDESNDREDMAKIVKYFRQQQALSKDLWMRQMGFSSTQDGPFAAALKPFVRADRSSMATSAIQQMPLAVQADLIDQLHYAIETSKSNPDKRSSLFNLAMCYLAGVGTEKVDIAKALGLLVEAAQGGSYKALAICFRLHDSLLGEVPSNLWEINHPVTRLEKSLSPLDSQMYFSERLRQYEKMQQAHALKRTFDVQQNGEIVLKGVHLSDAHTKLKGIQGLCAEDLECIAYLEGDDMPEIEGNLLVTAARLGLLPLVEFLFTRRAADKAWSEDVLTAACRGGHVNILRWLLGKEVSMLTDNNPLATPLHWLGSFEPDEAGVALELLISLPRGKDCLLQSIPHPGIQIGDCMVSGTPLEVAIAINNAPLVQAFLAIKLGDVKPQDYPKAIGWTTDTYPLAVALNLHHLLPCLIEFEKTYRDSLYITPTIPPLGLFDLVHPHDPLLPLLIHGQDERAALESTISFILATGTATLNDVAPSGATPLSHAIHHATSRFNLGPIPSLISRGARFGRNEWQEPMAITNALVKRRDSAAPSIMRYLLEAGVLSLSTEVLAAALQAGSTAVAAAILDTRIAGQTLDINSPLVVEEALDINSPLGPEKARIPLLFLAIFSDEVSTVRLLLDRGADLKARWDNRTVLEVTISVPNCNADIIDLLLARGAEVEVGEATIVHAASLVRSKVRGMHVLFHLLEHEHLRELVNTAGGVGLPLAVAACTGNVPAVHALLQAGARVRSGEELKKMLDVVVNSGRRPPNTEEMPLTMWGEKALDKQELYQWRVGMEEVVLALLDRGDPGHGRTRLHVAVQLGNRRRVVELVEEQGMRMFVGDREGLTPGAFLEDWSGLEEKGEDDEEYIEELKQLRDYVMRRMAEEVVADSTPKGLEKWLGDHPALSSGDSEEDRQAIEVTLTKLKLDSEETELAGGDGTESVADREVKLRRALETQKQRLGDTDLNTLRTMTLLYEVLGHQGKFEEANELHQIVLAERQVQLPPNHIDLFESLIDEIYIACGLGRIQEANEYALGVSRNVLETFGSHHPIAFKVETARASTESLLGKYEEAIKIQEAVLKLEKNLSFDQLFPDSSKRDDSLDFQGPLFYLRASLTLDYCRAQRFEAAAELAKSLTYKLSIAKPKEFWQVFEALMGVAAGLDFFGQHSVSVDILNAVVQACLDVHGKRKSHATYVALERLTSHYRQRGMWEKEGKWLQTLVDHLNSTVGPDHPDTIKQKRLLATALAKCESWVEASLIQEQVLRSLEQQASPGNVPGLELELKLELELAAVKVALCESLRHQNQLDRSAAYGWEAVFAYRASLGDDHETTLNAEYQLGTTLSLAGKSAEAISLLQRRVVSTVRTHGEMHIRTGIAVEALCAALVRAGRLEEAEEQAQRCLHISNHVPETSDGMLAAVLYRLAEIKELRGELEAARTQHAASLERLRADAGGVVTLDMLTIMCELARMHLEAGDLDAAEPVAREILVAAAGDSDSQPAWAAAHFLGRICEETDRGAEAVVHYRAVTESARRVLGNADELTLIYLADLVRALAAEGTDTEVWELATELLTLQRETYGEYHKDTVETKKVLAVVYPALGFWPEAERMQRDVLRFVEAMHPEEHEEVCILLEDLVTSCGKQRWSAEAEAFGRRAMDLRLANEGIEDEATLRVMADLARVLVDVGNMDEAEGMLNLVNETCQRLFDEGDHERDIATPASAYLRFKQGRIDEAIALQRTVVARDRDDLDAIHFLVQLHEKLNDYEEARKVLRSADSVAYSQSRAADEELEKIGLVRQFVQEIRLKTAMRDFEHAEGMAGMALTRTNKWHQLNYAHAELHLECLQAIEALFEALGKEEDLLQTRFRIKEQLHRQEEHRKQHLRELKTEADRFEKYRADPAQC